jgi:mannose/cellobiose epimerase-like protein (N-acyl-D-glucosamine 2-epimerase family)
VRLDPVTTAKIKAAHRDFRAWLFDCALPFWTHVSLDTQGPGFCEHLALDGRPAKVAYKRLRVQARQIYVFSQAHLLGWQRGAELAARGYGFIKTSSLRLNGEWAKTLRRDGSVLDPTVDLYDLAFVLFSLAWFARATGDVEALALARRTLAWTEQNMTHTSGGYKNSSPALPGPRLQNPHMHLLEAALALYESSGERAYARCALNILQLFRAHFKDASSGAIGEYYTEQFLSSPEAEGEHVEPGHLYEWVWLLDQAQKLLGVDARQDQLAVYEFAERHGVHTDSVSVIDTISRSGAPIRTSRRLWPQTEAIKAHCVMLRAGQPTCAQRVVDGVRHLLTTHLSECPPGAWRDSFTELGIANSGKIPASSLYHVMTAYSEVDRLAADVG